MENAKLDKACRDFEAYFTASLFAEMTKSMEINEKNRVSAQQEEWMWKMVGQTVADQLAQGKGMGLGQELLRAVSASPGTDGAALK